MCLAIPARVLSTDGTTAEVTIGDVHYMASLMLVEGIMPGDYVLLHAGFAIEKIDQDKADETLRLYDEIGKGQAF